MSEKGERRRRELSAKWERGSLTVEEAKELVALQAQAGALEEINLNEDDEDADDE